MRGLYTNRERERERERGRERERERGRQCGIIDTSSNRDGINLAALSNTRWRRLSRCTRPRPLGALSARAMC